MGTPFTGKTPDLGLTVCFTGPFRVQQPHGGGPDHHHTLTLAGIKDSYALLAEDCSRGTGRVGKVWPAEERGRGGQQVP